MCVFFQLIKRFVKLLLLFILSISIFYTKTFFIFVFSEKYLHEKGKIDISESMNSLKIVHSFSVLYISTTVAHCIATHLSIGRTYHDGKNTECNEISYKHTIQKNAQKQSKATILHLKFDQRMNKNTISC